MGFNATAVVCLDQLNFIENDGCFGKEFSNAILNHDRSSGATFEGPHGIRIVEIHHADYLVPVFVGGNTGRVIQSCIDIRSQESQSEADFRMLKDLARVLGYRVRKIPQKKEPLP